MNKPNEITMSTDQIEALIDGLQQQHKSIDTLSIHILKLTTLISGNELDKDDKGMIGQLKAVRQDVEVLKEERRKQKWVFAGIVLAGSFVIAIVNIAIKIYLNK